MDIPRSFYVLANFVGERFDGERGILCLRALVYTVLLMDKMQVMHGVAKRFEISTISKL